MGRWLCAVLLALTVLPVGAADCAWPAWQRFREVLVSADGRVIDRSSPRQVTTSEGQAYALFFALVADDRDGFARLLRWTESNLAGGDLRRHLPAWQWGRADDGRWRVLDDNNASDADLWLAYSLLEAGRLWRRPDYARLGQDLLWRSAAQTLQPLPGLGLMLLPGDRGFVSEAGWRLNPSYLPPQLLQRFADLAPVWAELADNTARLLREGAPKGLAPDWLLWRRGQGWAADPEHGREGDYDAIRVYLWLGMLADEAPGRAALQKHFAPMAELVAARGTPPERIDAADGRAEGQGPVGFSAALLPLLAHLAPAAHAVQRERLAHQPAAADAYYDQVLTLFGGGWDDGRFRFAGDGRLLPAWESTCAR